MTRFIAILALAAAFAAAASAQEGSVQEGLDYAQSVCARCHETGAGIMSPNPKAPPFGTIANTPGMTGAALHAILATPHRDMPDLVIPRKQMENLIAYILSLKQ